jgi:pyruvate,orthophosphate dikinase
MLGHRGCRLGVTYPEILRDAGPAIVEAAINVQEEEGRGQARDHDPAGGTAKELSFCSASVRGDHRRGQARRKFTGKLDIMIGTMIEIPARP